MFTHRKASIFSSGDTEVTLKPEILMTRIIVIEFSQ